MTDSDSSSGSDAAPLRVPSAEPQLLSDYVVTTRNGRPAGVFLSSDEYEALTETLEVLGADDALEALRDSEGDVRAGRVQSLDEVRREPGLA